MSGAGGLLALALLSPYLVMLLTALKPEGELRITPPRLTPMRWQPGNFLDVLGDPGFQGWLVSSLVVAGASTADRRCWRRHRRPTTWRGTDSPGARRSCSWCW